MEENNIRKYAELMSDLDLTALELTVDGTKLRLERSGTPVLTAPAAVPVLGPAGSSTVAAGAPVGDANVQTVLSPMVGVFYSAAADNQPNFVAVGDQIKRGQVLCIIESMKLMNEITSEFDGVLIEICVGNQQVVDYAHPLFLIRKEAL